MRRLATCWESYATPGRGAGDRAPRQTATPLSLSSSSSSLQSKNGQKDTQRRRRTNEYPAVTGQDMSDVTVTERTPGKVMFKYRRRATLSGRKRYPTSRCMLRGDCRPSVNQKIRKAGRRGRTRKKGPEKRRKHRRSHSRRGRTTRRGIIDQRGGGGSGRQDSVSGGFSMNHSSAHRATASASAQAAFTSGEGDGHDAPPMPLVLPQLHLPPGTIGTASTYPASSHVSSHTKLRPSASREAELR